VGLPHHTPTLSIQQMSNMQEPAEEINTGKHSSELDVASLLTVLSLTQTHCLPFYKATWQS